MRARVAFVVLVLSTSSAWAELPPPPDELSKAYDNALAELHAGKDRQSIADRLKPVVEKHPTSYYASIVASFLRDLAASAKKAPAEPDDPPEQRLAETRVPLHLLWLAENWDKPLKAFVAKEPEDPTAQLVAADRTVIDRLIPLLADRQPTRCDNSNPFGRPTQQPRVCDLALGLIEYHAKARFYHDTIQGVYLHQLPEAEREKVANRVTEWWEEVKDKSVTAGVRAQLVHGRSYPETVWMAKTLARLAEGQETDDREFALNVLREMVKQFRRHHVGAYAAEALAELGDKSVVDIFYEEWKSSLGRRGLIHESKIAFYLCKYGGRREWELLHAISLAEFRNGKGPSAGAVWACVVNSRPADANPYAIPILGPALDQTENTGSRAIDGGSQSFSYADKACELLQKQVGKDFGYRRNGTAAERLAAIKQAQGWWDAEGKTKYTFDYIEKNMVPGDAAHRGRNWKSTGAEPAIERCCVRPKEFFGMEEMLYPEEAFALLREMRYDPEARREFESLSSSFYWPDEGLRQAMRLCRNHDSRATFYTMAYRTSLIKGEPIEEYRRNWEQLQAACPDWPGFRPERCSTELLPAWRRARKRMCVDFEREMRAIERDEALEAESGDAPSAAGM